VPDPEFQLSDEANERVFRERIVPRELSHAKSQESPTAIFIAGQQGAGKSRSLAHFSRELEARGGFINVNSDTYKPHHPAYADIVADDDRLMAARTGPDGRKWTNKAHAYARDNRFNVICEETMQNPEYFAAMAQSYRDAGYRVEVAMLAVPKAQSQQGILNRYYEQTKDGGPGRLTVPEKHEASYNGILETADLIDSGRVADSVSVRRRGGDPIYSNHLTASGEWASPPATRAAIENERDRQWTPEESAEFTATQKKLADGLGEGWSTQLAEVDSLAEPYLAREAPRTPPDQPVPDHDSTQPEAEADQPGEVDSSPRQDSESDQSPEPNARDEERAGASASEEEADAPAEEEAASRNGDSFDSHEDTQLSRIADADADESESDDDYPGADASPRAQDRERGGMGD
jgi:predicted ABC-type ATPase